MMTITRTTNMDNKKHTLSGQGDMRPDPHRHSRDRKEYPASLSG